MRAVIASVLTALVTYYMSRLQGYSDAVSWAVGTVCSVVVLMGVVIILEIRKRIPRP